MLMTYRHVSPSDEGIRDPRVESRNTNELDSPIRVPRFSRPLSTKQNTAYEANEDTTVWMIKKRKKPVEIGGLGNQ